MNNSKVEQVPVLILYQVQDNTRYQVPVPVQQYSRGTEKKEARRRRRRRRRRTRK